MDTKKLADILIAITQKVGNVIKETKDLGKQRIVDDPKDLTTKGDLAACKVIREMLKEHSVPAVIVSEEKGGEDLTPDGTNPEFLIVCDEIDGTENYARGRENQPYGTIITAFSTLEPTFADAVVAVIRIHTTNTVFYAIKGEGCFVVENGITKKCETSNRTQIAGDIRAQLRLDVYGSRRGIQAKELVGLFADTWIKDFGSTAYHFCTVPGSMSDIFVNSGCKGEEIGAGYLLVTEAGGYMCDFTGEEFATKLFKQEGTYALVAAASRSLAEEVVGRLSSENETKTRT